MQSKRIHYNLAIHEDQVKVLRSLNRPVSSALREAIFLVSSKLKYLYQVYSKSDNSAVFIISDTNSEVDILQKIALFPYMASRMKVVGLGEYDISLIGCFPKMDDCVSVMEFYINRLLDKGIHVANEYNRFVVLQVDIPLVNKLFKSNADLSKLITLILKEYNVKSTLIEKTNLIKSKIAVCDTL